MTYFPELITEAQKPDIVAESNNATYCGWFDRKNCNHTQPAEKQPIWKIRKITTEEKDGTTYTRIVYPNGNFSAEHIWEERETYEYKYKK